MTPTLPIFRFNEPSIAPRDSEIRITNCKGWEPSPRTKKDFNLIKVLYDMKEWLNKYI